MDVVRMGMLKHVSVYAYMGLNGGWWKPWNVGFCDVGTWLLMLSLLYKGCLVWIICGELGTGMVLERSVEGCEMAPTRDLIVG